MFVLQRGNGYILLFQDWKTSVMQQKRQDTLLKRASLVNKNWLKRWHIDYDANMFFTEIMLIYTVGVSATTSEQGRILIDTWTCCRTSQTGSHVANRVLCLTCLDWCQSWFLPALVQHVTKNLPSYEIPSFPFTVCVWWAEFLNSVPCRRLIT